MKYYHKETLEKVARAQEISPAITVNLDHPSLVVFERLSMGSKKSVIIVPEGSTFDSLLGRITDVPSYERFVDDFGDEHTRLETLDIVRDSWVERGTGRFDMGREFREIVLASEILKETQPAPPPPSPPAKVSDGSNDF